MSKARIRRLGIWAVIAASAGAVGNFGFGVDFWLVAALTMMGLVVNGWIIEWEDRQPGGWDSDS